MKKRVLVLAAFVAFCLISVCATAQERLKMELSYNVSVPVGGFKSDYIGKTSGRGGVGEIKYAITPKFSLGLMAGYQNYYQKYDRNLYKLEGNQVVSAVLTNNMDVMPLLLRGTYFPTGSNERAVVQPYFSLATGVNFVNYGQYLGEFGSTKSSTAFAAQAGAGIQIPVGVLKETAIKIGGTYNYVNYNKNNISRLDNIGINAGVVFKLR